MVHFLIYLLFGLQKFVGLKTPLYPLSVLVRPKKVFLVFRQYYKFFAVGLLWVLLDHFFIYSGGLKEKVGALIALFFFLFLKDDDTLSERKALGLFALSFISLIVSWKMVGVFSTQDFHKSNISLSSLFIFVSFLFLRRRNWVYYVTFGFGLLGLGLACSRGLFISLFFPFLLNHVPIQGKRIVPWTLPFMLCPFLIPDRLLHGRGDLYPVFFGNWRLWPQGIGSLSSEVIRLLEAIYPAHERNTYIHNVHLEVMYDFGALIYILLLGGYLAYAGRKQLALTSFILFFTLSFNYTIYSPVTWLLLAAAYRFDILRANAKG